LDASGSTDSTGNSARFSSPEGVAVDGAGNIYLADTFNHTIRKVTSTGAVTTLAGSAGLSGSTDGAGSLARFNYPTSVGVDGAGNLVVSDWGNHAIRKVTSAGVVTTLAGSPVVSGAVDGSGSVARFFHPEGVAVDRAGNVWVADSGNHTIRKVTSAGVVTTLAGSAGLSGAIDGAGGVARFNYPEGIVVDGSGNVYVADTDNHTIRKITSSGAVTTLAGSAGVPDSIDGTGSAARFIYPRCVAVDSAGNVFVADANNHTIRRITIAGVVTTVGGELGYPGVVNGMGSLARFDLPSAVAVDSVGNIYIADTNNHKLRKGVPPVPVLASPVVATSTAGQAFSYTPTYTGSPIGFTATGLPAGLSVSTTTGVISGTPTVAGTYFVALGATNAVGTNAVTITLTVTAAAKANQTITFGALANKTFGDAPFTVSATASSGLAPSFSIVSGPANVTGSTVTITAAGTVVVSAAQAGDANYNAATPVTQSFTVAKATPVVTWVTPAAVTAGSALSATQLNATANVPGTFTYAPTTGTVLAAGARTLSVAFAPTDAANYNAVPVTTVSLTVNGPPTITTAPGNTTVVAGQVATLTVAATGNPAPTYQWQRQAAGTTGFVALANGGGYAGVTTATLSVTTTAAMHGDQFRAVASNGIGTAATSTVATLSVNAPPAITSAGVATFYIGQPTTFTFTATGNPAPTFSVSAGALPAWATLNATTGALTGTPPNLTGSPFTFSITASNGVAPAATQAFTLTVQAATLPTITAQPISRSVAVGTNVSFAVTAVGTAPLSYVWRKDGVLLAGATGATLTIGSAQTTDTGAYTVAITNAVGNAVSNVATLGVVPPGSGATHAIVGPGYVPGSLLTITNTLTFTGAAATSLGWRVLLPAGWIFVSGSATQGETKPALGTTDLLEWAWSTPPASPLTFTYTLNVPAGQTGPKDIVALAVLRQGAAPIELLATPDPLVIDRVGTHSADTTRDFRIGLIELTRVIELYNTRIGTTRTGAYRVQGGTEDGFAPDPARTAGSVVALAKYHSGDSPPTGAGSPPDGSIGLVELTRVIELYNARSGTVRTGAYHAQAGTEDGFSPGP
jgi:sugar lactone lactonase YvrE